MEVDAAIQHERAVNLISTQVAKHDDDDEPPMRLGGDRAHALGRHQGLGGLTRAGVEGYGERLVWDGEDASRALLRVAAKNVPLKHVRKAVAEAVGEEEAGALASDEAIRVSGLSQCGTFFQAPTPTTRTT